MKTGVWTKSVFKKLLQLAQMVYYGREYEEDNKRQKKNQTDAPTMGLDLLWNSLRKMPRGTRVKTDGLAITVERRGISSGIALRLLNCPQLHAQSLKDHNGEETALRGVDPRVRLSRQSDRRCPGVPTQAPILITPEETQVLITVEGQSVDFFWTPGQLSLC